MSKRMLLSLLGAVTLVAAAVASFRSEAQQAPAQREVIMIRCDLEFNVDSYQGSASAPGKRAANCAENISLLHRDGFSVEDVGHFDVGDGALVYTMVR